jgi:hypothetical protein
MAVFGPLTEYCEYCRFPFLSKNHAEVREQEKAKAEAWNKKVYVYLFLCCSTYYYLKMRERAKLSCRKRKRSRGRQTVYIHTVYVVELIIVCRSIRQSSKQREKQ